MKKRLSSRVLFILAFVLLVAVNGLVIFGVAYNRSGEPDAVVVLSEREFHRPYHKIDEDSGMALVLDWQALGRQRSDRYDWYDYRSRYPEWLDAAKLRKLGFDVDRYRDRDRHGPDTPMQVFVVLELGGEPYRRFLERAEAAFGDMEARYRASPDDEQVKNDYNHFKNRIQDARTRDSRLFAVDAGADPAALRRHYTDRTRFVIAPALVTIDTFYYGNSRKEDVVGRIQKLSVEQVHVPRKHKRIFAGTGGQERQSFQVEVAYGKRLEPWIRSVTQQGAPR
ncbi:MAG: DUF4824 family protein [Thermodesulfobacteriota bacterium]